MTKSTNKDIHLTKQQYKFIAEMIWGSVPVDTQWAEESNLFKVNAPILLEKYPLLNKSFHEEIGKNYYRGKKLNLIERFSISAWKKIKYYFSFIKK